MLMHPIRKPRDGRHTIRCPFCGRCAWNLRHAQEMDWVPYFWCAAEDRQIDRPVCADCAGRVLAYDDGVGDYMLPETAKAAAANE